MAAAKGTDNECIQVVARCRPLNRKENEEKRQNIVFIDSALRQIAIKVPDSGSSGEEMKSFTFDAAYDEHTQQKIFYEESCFSIIECALEGFNSTIFAYGQTGCGKSFTMQGPSNAGDDMKGVIPNSFSHIFQFIKASKDVEFLIRCSYLELYNEEIRDLLCNPKNQTKCELKEDAQKGIFVKNLTDVVVETKEDLEAMLDKGLGNRTVASTLMNSESSRSHSIFTIIIEMTSKDKDSGKEMLRAGKLNLVDLAGSERQKKTGAKDATLKEGIKINLSLSALGNVISALSEGGKHIPYRDSKLTRLLQDSLGGNSKTMMIAAISPADYNYDETLSTLRYANRAKNIKNKPKVNEDPKDTIIREFKEEIERLRKLLQEQSVLHSSLNTSNNPSAAAPVANSVSLSPSNQSHIHVPAPTTGVPLETVEERNELDYTISNSHNSSPLQLKLSDLSSPPLTATEAASVTLTPLPQQQLRETIQSPPQQQPSQVVQSPPPVQDNGMMEKVKEAHEKLMEKEYEIELERQMREELTLRLQQLQSMLVISNNTSVDRVDSADVGTTASGITSSTALESNSFAKKISTDVEQKTATVSPTELTAEEKKRIQEEEEAQQRYKERRAKAKKQKELKQQQEMQRILEEKRLMEEELEELRLSSQANSQAAAMSTAPSAAPSKNGSQSSTARGSPPVAQGQSEGADNSTNAMRKVSKMKKRYEKKLLAAEEELQEIREDFYYQRKQLLDAVIEQEKDTKLYEQICRAVLSEKDFKKIIEKSRYDEDAEEWIIPYMKRKSFDALDSSRGGQLYHHTPNAPSSAAIASPSHGSVHSSGLLPDINHSSQYNKSSLGLDKIETANAVVGAKGSAATAAVAAAIAAASKSDGSSNTARSGAASRVPILTLPGGLTSASSLATSPLYSHRSEGVSYAAQSESAGYTGDMPGIGFEKEKRKKSSHGKHKIPKGTGGNSSSRMNETQILPANINKIPVSGRQSPAPAPQPYQQIAIDEAGSGIAAGPIDDWGFANENSPSTNGGATNRGAAAAAAASKNNQESEYSDDEDFEPDESTPVPHPPTAGSKPPGSAAGMSNRKLEKKKKKKVKNISGDHLASIYNSQSGDYNDDQTSSNGSTSVRQQQSPRVVMLPPIG